MDFLKDFIVKLLAKFRASNPTVFLVIASVLTVLKGLIDADVIGLPANVSSWVLWFIALFISTPLVAYLPKTKGKPTVED